MLIAEWEVPFILVSPAGTLSINVAADPGARNGYVLDPKGCSVDRPLRVTTDNIPQHDGEIFHRRFSQGYEATLKITFWDAGTPACNDALTDLTDALMLHLNALLNPPEQNGRLIWTPTGKAARMFDALRWLSYPSGQTPGDKSNPASVSVGFDTPYPYAISQTQTTPAIGVGVVNAGTANFWPVLKVNGPSSAFVVTSDPDVAMGIVYDSSRPGATALGAGDYAEIDMFRKTITLNGDQAFLDAGVDWELSQFFYLFPGTNDLSIVGASGTVLLNDAWA